MLKLQLKWKLRFVHLKQATYLKQYYHQLILVINVNNFVFFSPLLQLPHLTYIDQNMPLNSVIQQFLAHWNIDEPSSDYAFQFNTHLNTYVNEKNRVEITDGTMLRLIHSPSKTTRDILEKLQNSSGLEKRSALETLVKFSSDYIFAAEFIEQQGKDFLIMLIEEDSISSAEGLGLVLEALIELMNHGICRWADF